MSARIPSSHVQPQVARTSSIASVRLPSSLLPAIAVSDPNSSRISRSSDRDVRKNTVEPRPAPGCPNVLHRQREVAEFLAARYSGERSQLLPHLALFLAAPRRPQIFEPIPDRHPFTSGKVPIIRPTALTKSAHFETAVGRI